MTDNAMQAALDAGKAEASAAEAYDRAYTAAAEQWAKVQEQHVRLRGAISAETLSGVKSFLAKHWKAIAVAVGLPASLVAGENDLASDVVTLIGSLF